jgi:two-component system response regulator FixJ
MHMNNETRVSLIDGDVRRRAAIAHSLANGGVPTEPLENVEELIARWPVGGIILAHDEDGVLPALMRYVGQTGRWLPVIAYAQQPAPARVVEAVLEGAIGYLAWPIPANELTDAIAAVSNRAERMGRVKLREAAARSRVDRLTRREREVLSGVASGLSNRKIGERLSISPRTVEIHRANMLNKMGASHTSEAIRLAIEASLIA